MDVLFVLRSFETLTIPVDRQSRAGNKSRRRTDFLDCTKSCTLHCMCKSSRSFQFPVSSFSSFPVSFTKYSLLACLALPQSASPATCSSRIRESLGIPSSSVGIGILFGYPSDHSPRCIPMLFCKARVGSEVCSMIAGLEVASASIVVLAGLLRFFFSFLQLSLPLLLSLHSLSIL